MPKNTNAGDPLTGEELYARYVQLFAERDCDVDPWEELAEIDREVWNELAETSTGV